MGDSRKAGALTQEVVELRVHGLSGTSAEKLLDHPVVIRVAGDRHAGFYRPRPGFGISDRPSYLRVEVYRWGALTAGRAVRTLSLLFLLPFMLINVATWARPATGGAGGVIGSLCRLLAVTLTAAFTLSLIGVTIDIIGWQCVPYQPCRAGRSYLSWLVELPLGPRLALLALVPIGALRLLWWLGTLSARALEGFRASPGQDRATGGEDRVDAPGFWNDSLVVQRLRAIHMAVGLGVLDASLLGALLHVQATPVGYALIGAVFLLLAAGIVLLSIPARLVQDTPGRGPVNLRGIRPLRIAAIVLTVLTLGYSAMSSGPEQPEGKLPGYEGGVAGLITVQAILLVGLFVATLHQRRRSLADSPSWLAGLGTPTLAVGAFAAAYGFAAALVYRVADILDRADVPNPAWPGRPDAPPLEPPVSYRWAAVAGLVAILAVAATTLWRLVATRRYRQRLADQVVESDFPGDQTPEALSRRTAVQKAVARAAVIEQLSPVVAVFLLLSLLGAAIVALDIFGIGPSELARRLGDHGDSAALRVAIATDIGVFFIELTGLGILLLGLLSYRSEETRRSVAAVWDLGTFWPRTVHPFAPPCYAERAVPELAKRVTTLTGNGAVILSGHSHGSVLAAAALLQLPPQVLDRVALLTHGSPLHRLYSRIFPAFFGDPVLHELGERIGWRWVNLWRNTDAVGGPIFSAHRPGQPPQVTGPAGEVDRRLRDPRSLTVPPDDTVPPPINRHWPYHTDEAYEAAVRELAERLRTGSGSGAATAGHDG